MHGRWRYGLWAAALGILASNANAAVLVAESQAARCGLTRAWYAQVGSLRTSGPIQYLHYADGLVLVQTERGVLTALNAETGRTLWRTQVGPRGRLASEAAASKDHVAVVSGSTLYILDRIQGHTLWQRRLGGAPGAGPTVSDTHAFVPMVDGMIEGYALDGSTKFRPWRYKSTGRVLIRPLATAQSVIWTTEKGHFYVADSEASGIRYRLETRDAIQARPGYWTPNVYAGSTDGYVYAVNEINGKIHWKFAVGDGIFEPPVAIEDKVFVISQFRGMTCLDAKTSKELWVAPGVKQFVSASAARLYVIDDYGRLTVLSIDNGGRLASMALEDISLKLLNSRSDRLYLANSIGVVQCLHEVELKAPLLHNPPPPPPRQPTSRPKQPTDEEAPTEPEGELAPEEPATDSASPAADEGAPDAPAEMESDDPFGGNP